MKSVEQQQWSLLAAHVRTNHVHLVVEAEARPERIMNDIKSYASLSEPQRTGRTWSQALGTAREHAMVVKPEHLAAAIRYVVEEHGEAMSVFEVIES